MPERRLCRHLNPAHHLNPALSSSSSSSLSSSASQIIWAFSIYLESVAIWPQLYMLAHSGEAETITAHYLFALGSYRALYLLNWIYRYVYEGHVDYVAWIAGTVQTILYADFFYIYITKYVCPAPPQRRPNPGMLTRWVGEGSAGSCVAKSSSFPSRRQRPGSPF